MNFLLIYFFLNLVFDNNITDAKRLWNAFNCFLLHNDVCYGD